MADKLVNHGLHGLKPRITRIKTGQVTLELALIFICLVLLLFGSLKIFFWANDRFVSRQKGYEATRVDAGSSDPGAEVDESAYPKLNIFGGKE